MLYFLHEIGLESDSFSFLRLFRYVTFRAAGAGAFAFLLVLLLGPYTACRLRRLKALGLSRVPGAEVNEHKIGVPTMGGLLILIGIIASILLWAIPNALVLIFLGLLIATGFVGFLDDYKKLLNQNTDGLSERGKLIFQAFIGLCAVYALHAIPETGENVRKLMFPFFKDPVVENMALWLAIPFGGLVVVATSNAVNLSDGMDGLAIGLSIICAITYAIFAYICGHSIFANYLQVPFVPGCSEVVVIAGAMVGAGLGFLWHNCYPAAMYMGDTGSLSIGGAIGLIAVLVKQEILLVLVGGVFVAEAGSSLLQRYYYKLTRKLTGEPKRLFKCAPIHHHFEKKDDPWHETQIVIRFWIIGIILAALGLATLKIR
jgi:phospho-N-acetylmuramoyl-pentapeptide-transferase